MSTAQLTVSDFEMTPMRVSYKAPGASVFSDMGGTMGNVVVTIGYKKAPLKADQSGTEPIDHKVSGLEVKVSTTIAEVQNKQKWLVAFPHAAEVAQTVLGATISVAAPGIVSAAAHGFQIGDAVKFTAGTLPTGLSLSTIYYVISDNFAAGTFSVAATAGGVGITTTGSAGSGVTIVGAGSSSVALDFYTNIGSGGQANAGELLLHPLSKPDLDKDTDYLFYKACALAATEVTYGPDQQAGLKIEWFIYPDLDNSQRYFRYGDADLV